MMNYHLLFFRTGARLREYKKHLQTRRAYCLLATVTYTNTLLFAWMMFRQYELLVDILFCISSVFIGVSITGLYLSTPLIMLPDVVFKVILATFAFFNAVQEVDEGKEYSVVRLALVVVGYTLQFYENYFLFNAIVHLYRAKEAVVRPPPEYNCFVITAPKKEKEEGLDEEEISQDHSTTPPPSYALALARMARQFPLSPGQSSSRTFEDGRHEQSLSDS